MSKPAEEPTLSPGIAFHLQPDGSWAPENLPHKVLVEGEFSGFLTIEGYRCSVFETSDGSMWAQKSVNTPATASTKEHVEPDMSKKCPECGGKATDVRGYSACCKNGHFFNVKPEAASTFGKPSEAMNSIASRVAAAWLANQNPDATTDGAVDDLARIGARADDVVSQVNEILEGGGLSQDDTEYDEDITAWCEKVQEKIPEMQEIFDTAFHAVMDFKSKVPASDNPRVRTIADEKVAKMLNEAAARLEIISHGLMQEMEALCGGLATGAGAEAEEAPAAAPPAEEPAEEPEAPAEPPAEEEAPKAADLSAKKEEEQGQAQQASSPRSIATELKKIAAALDRSKNPDRNLVAHDIREVLARLA